jgi:hypothetical protein
VGELIGYARCSTVLQDLTAQHEILAGLGVPGDRIYLDKGLTGTKPRPARPGPGPRGCRLSGLSSEFAELWARHEVAEFKSRTWTFVHPAAGPLTFTRSVLQVPVTQDGRITVYTPADDETRKQLPLTRELEP